MESVYLPGSKADVYSQTGIDTQRQDRLSALANTDDEEARASSTELFNMLRKPGSPEMIDLKINHTVNWDGGEYTFDVPREIYLPIIKLYNNSSTGIKDYIENNTAKLYDPKLPVPDIEEDLGEAWHEVEEAWVAYYDYVRDVRQAVAKKHNIPYPLLVQFGKTNSDQFNKIYDSIWTWTEY